MDFSDILVIKLVPLAVDDILAVSYVMPACNRENAALLGFGADRTQAGITLAVQTGLAAGREQREMKEM